MGNTEKPGVLDTAINIIGGLSDSDVILKTIDSYFSEKDSLKDLFNKRNEFNLRTERSRTRIERAVRKNFLKFINEDHEDLLKGIFKTDIPMKDKELVLVWQFALNNTLFREITTKVFVKIYLSGRTSISKDDVAAFLKDFLDQIHEKKTEWAQSTINTISTKYLNLMGKLNFLETGKVRTFKNIRPSSEAQVLFLYFAKLFAPFKRDILTNELLPISFIPLEDILQRLKKVSIKGLFDMNFNGVTLNIELTHSFKGICDVLYNRL